MLDMVIRGPGIETWLLVTTGFSANISVKLENIFEKIHGYNY